MARRTAVSRMPVRRVPRLLGVLALHALLLAPRSSPAQRADSVAARVADAVCDREVVLLGELPTHGEARAFQAKAAIVDRLVERCGFDALLFEAPIYDFVGLQAAVARRRAEPAQLDRAIGRFWWTRELADWRGRLFRRVAEGALVVGGLDDQVSVTSEHARATLPALVAASTPAPDAAACEQAVARHLAWRYDAAQPFDRPEQARLRRCARGAADALAARGGNARGTAEQTMLESFAGHVERSTGVAGARDRDAVMARNLAWHLARLPAGSKVIVWTATVHAARQQGGRPEQPMGARLAARLGDRLAAVGFTALGGHSSMAGQPRVALPSAPAGSLEARATEGGVAWAYLDAAALRTIGRVPSRLLGSSFASADWSTLFDAVVVFREEVAPTFDPWR